MCSDLVPYPSTGGLYEIGGGWHARTRLEATRGIDWQEKDWTVSGSASSALQVLSDFNTYISPRLYLENNNNGLQTINEQAQNLVISARIENAKRAEHEGSRFEYTKRDVILYSKSSLETPF